MKQQTEPMHPILAKFHEAKEAGFEWADEAINDFDERLAKTWQKRYNLKKTYSGAILFGIDWVNSRSVIWSSVYYNLKDKGL